jgi:hypothetical protein
VTARLLSLGKSPRYAFDMRMGRPQRRSRRCGEEKSLALPEIETRILGCPVTTPTELFRLVLKELPDFTVHQGSLPWSEEPTTGPYPESDESSSHPHTLLSFSYYPPSYI